MVAVVDELMAVCMGGGWGPAAAGLDSAFCIAVGADRPLVPFEDRNLAMASVYL